MDIEQFIVESNRAENGDTVFELFQKALLGHGFDRVIYSLITEHRSIGQQAGHGVQKNYPADWMQHYMQNGYEKLDPVPRFAFTSARPFTWSWLRAETPLDRAAVRVMSEAEEAGLHDGVGIPIHGPNGEIAGVGLASSSKGVRPEKDRLCVLRTLALQFHLAYAERQISSDTDTIRLTAREKEILLWAAEGKSDQVIADILGVAYPTIRYHLQNIFRKLGANERTFAVVKALRIGLITPSIVLPR